MGKVRSPHDAVDAHFLNLIDTGLVLLDRSRTSVGTNSHWLHGQFEIFELIFPLVIEAFEYVRNPANSCFTDDDLEVGRRSSAPL